MTTYGFVPVGSRHSEISINDSVYSLCRKCIYNKYLNILRSRFLYMAQFTEEEGIKHNIYTSINVNRNRRERYVAK
jgi:hypothetical protein